MKIALVQVNPIIGDFRYNCEKITRFAQKAVTAGCDLAVFPELAVSGYPPLDLLERRSFIDDHEAAVKKLIEELPPIPVMFGCFERCEEPAGKPLYNSVFVARGGTIVHKTRKQLLPEYDVFDENRYFEPGSPSDLFSCGGLNIGVTVCEDIWHYAVDEYHSRPVADLHAQALKKGRSLDLLINVSASPYHRGKTQVRQSIFSTLTAQYGIPFFYVNQVGGQDSLLFDGVSLALDGSGKTIARAAHFEEDMVVVDTEQWSGELRSNGETEEVELVHDALVMGIHDYVTKSGFSQAVLGLSGGIDSALTAALAVRALGAENVLGIALPSPYSSKESLEDAEALARGCGCRFEIVPIADLFEGYRKSLGQLFAGREEDVTEQNIQARIRGNLLMALSNKFNHLLLTTGNKSEMAVGYCTLYGDMSGGLAVISDVPKQLVYDLARFINRSGDVIPSTILEKPPSAELKPDQRDEDDLPPYELLDQILELYLEEGCGKAEIVRRGFDPVVVDDIVRRIRINEYKRKQAPMGLKVTSKAFGFGRRLPNVQNYRG
ncbi:MAG: NAD+ synthase [Desulfofustis sp.]|nr:NAD+ synthase [Desulfofustis sp.]